MKTKKTLKLGVPVIILILMVPLVAFTYSNKSYKGFVKYFMCPTDAKVNSHYTYPLPEGYEKVWDDDMIIQSECKDSYSLNVMTRYVNDKGINVVEVYKNNQNKVTNNFIKLVGFIQVAKYGYPQLMFDSPVINVGIGIPGAEGRGLQAPLGEITDIYTFVATLLPQATEEQWDIFFGCLKDKSDADGIPYVYPYYPLPIPDWIGPGFWLYFDGINIDMMKEHRDDVLSCYEEMTEQTEAVIPFDYSQYQDRQIFQRSGREEGLFAALGMCVPSDAQAAFFTAITYVPVPPVEE